MSKITLDALFEKSMPQLYKEVDRRGLSRLGDRYHLIQTILEHDAYYEGVNDARRDCVKNGKPGCSVPQKIIGVYPPEPAPERELYVIVNGEEPCDEPWIMRLTPEQERFIRVLKDHNIIDDCLEISKIPHGEIIIP